MATQDLTPLTKAHDENAARGKPLKPYQLTVQYTPEEQAAKEKLDCFEVLTFHRKLVTERGVPK